MTDPLFEHELAESLHMTVTELIHGRGTPISAHELCVRQPLYFEYKARQIQREQQKAEMKSRGPR